MASKYTASLAEKIAIIPVPAVANIARNRVYNSLESMHLWFYISDQIIPTTLRFKELVRSHAYEKFKEL